jgi:tetratricopeptide (TPR) repeat protein
LPFKKRAHEGRSHLKGAHFILNEIRSRPVERRCCCNLSAALRSAKSNIAGSGRANPRFAEAHNNLGFTLSQQGPQNYSTALEHYNKAIQLKPKMAEAYEYRAMLLLRMGRKADAEKDLATLKKLNPKLAREP